MTCFYQRKISASIPCDRYFYGLALDGHQLLSTELPRPGRTGAWRRRCVRFRERQARWILHTGAGIPPLSRGWHHGPRHSAAEGGPMDRARITKEVSRVDRPDVLDL